MFPSDAIEILLVPLSHQRGYMNHSEVLAELEAAIYVENAELAAFYRETELCIALALFQVVDQGIKLPRQADRRRA